MHAKQSTLREINAAVVLDQIRAHPPISRAQIARTIGMSKPTVANALELLLSAGLVRPTIPPDEIHYGATYFEPVTDLCRVLGLDIGSRSVRGALADIDGVLLARHDEPLPNPAAETVLATATVVRDQLLKQLPEPDIPVELAVAGVPGVVDPDVGVIRQSSRPEFEGVPIKQALQDALRLDALVENDINLAAFGEQMFGAGREHSDFAFLSVGDAVGAGLVLDGRLHRGHHGAAGEIDNPAQGETEAPDSPSGDALLAMINSGAFGDDLPADIASGDQLFALARNGSRTAHALLGEEARRIAVRIAQITRVTDVELVVLGGSIGLACADLLPQITGTLNSLVLFPPDIQISRLGDTPVLVGALARGAELAMEIVTARGIGGSAQIRSAAAHDHQQMPMKEPR